MKLPTIIYTDGGVIGVNPSKIGGVWCYVWSDESDKVLHHQVGMITPKKAELPVITNNLTELLAAIKALESVPDGWSGIICTDSKVTQSRLIKGFYSNSPGVPLWLKQQFFRLRKSRKFTVSLVKGHPSKKELSNGLSESGVPVHALNVYADRCCTELVKKYLGVV